MPAVASLEQLNSVMQDLQALQAEHSLVYDQLVAVFRKHRKVGYKNICKLMMGEATPEKLKGIG